MTSEALARPARARARRGIPAMLRAYSSHRYGCLFATLLLTLAAGPTLDVLLPRYNPLEVLLALNLIAALASIAYEGRMRVPIVLGGSFIAARGVRAVLGIPGMLAFSEVVWITAIVLVMVASVRRALRAGVVNPERILAALDAYLLAGLVFGIAYRVVDQLWPSSFGGTRPLGLAQAIYFSFGTLATLGYGDVVPVSEPARGLAILEGVSGQMYLAVLVARLVSLYSQQRDS